MQSLFLALKEKFKAIKEKGLVTKRDVFEWLEVIVTAMVAVVVVFTLVFKVVTIDGGSMRETLHNGDKVVISNLFYTPKQKDVVVISRNIDNSYDNESQAPIIKRVIATEGQIVDIDFNTGMVYVDGVALDEPYTRTPTNLSYDIQFPVKVDDGCVFVLGDNRNDSHDSRSSLIGNNGMIDTRYILGKAILKVFPFSEIGGIE
ncbi:MAG: signal peptidase I [Ruminococcaceae bacterium]|nr:signal peptidase I [Oscillospiraceae bacterium]